MPQFPILDQIALPATLNSITGMAVVVDRTYLLCELNLSPGAAKSMSVAAGKVSGLDFPALTGAKEVATVFSSTNLTFPSSFRWVELFIGNQANPGGYGALDTAVNRTYIRMVGAMPLVDPPVIERGELLIIAAKNLTSSAQICDYEIDARIPREAAWNLLGKGTRIGDSSPT